MSEEKDTKKELAKLKRLAIEIAGEIHDIVEDTLWSEYNRLPELAQACAEAVKKANDYKKANGL